jgi:magnesium-transporting ATPase (P-type)
VAFENKLKHDTRQTIDRLVEARIEPKIITGDNIFIAVETGVRAGVISASDQVILLEGRKQTK